MQVLRWINDLNSRDSVANAIYPRKLFLLRPTGTSTKVIRFSTIVIQSVPLPVFQCVSQLLLSPPSFNVPHPARNGSGCGRYDLSNDQVRRQPWLRKWCQDCCMRLKEGPIRPHRTRCCRHRWCKGQTRHSRWRRRGRRSESWGPCSHFRG